MKNIFIKTTSVDMADAYSPEQKIVGRYDFYIKVMGDSEICDFLFRDNLIYITTNTHKFQQIIEDKPEDFLQKLKSAGFEFI